MKKVYAMIADGTEEVECLGVVDILRRAGLKVSLVSVSNGCDIVSSHNVRITADLCIKDVDFSDADLLFVPGGMPGTKNMSACGKLIAAIKSTQGNGKRVAAICAAPALVLGAHGFLDGKSAVCFPGFEQYMTGAKLVPGGRVVTDGNITTARGLGCTVELGLELVRLLSGEDKAEELKTKIQF